MKHERSLGQNPLFSDTYLDSLTVEGNIDPSKITEYELYKVQAEKATEYAYNLKTALELAWAIDQRMHLQAFPLNTADTLLMRLTEINSNETLNEF